jgi:hypothetical protein
LLICSACFQQLFSFTHTNCPAPNNVEQAKIKKAIKSLSLSARALLSCHHRQHIDDLSLQHESLVIDTQLARVT